ncbi:MAG: bifunctional histidinol-phosphatase/imidazoleglycerol-phosphate dehydratase HisB [Flavobacteriales bacterium]|jgi:imidazoleglycerol-phosphate dehydratase/histidinol-phosphatase|nr:bifunctional histidinol-phosphatase/imidazoleglycerol-phosphate dehydratase HisB [Flavobacteriales bacterium]
MRKVLFIDRDGTLVKEPPVDYQLDAFEKLEFYPDALIFLSKIARELDFELVMVSNQDGLGTDSFPEDHFWPVHNLMMQTFEGVGVRFDKVLIDKSFPEENAPTRKPRIGLLNEYLDSAAYNLKESFVIGDRPTDMQLALNLGCQGIYMGTETAPGQEELNDSEWQDAVGLSTLSWEAIYRYLKLESRLITWERNTKETKISLKLNLDGTGKSTIDTGIAFFDHMLDQLSRHGQMDLELKVKGDLEVDEHHTIEDTALALGEAFDGAIGDKMGMERYGFCLPMDDCLAQVAIDFGGRPWLVWEAAFKREYVGKMPTEMFMHFFKSFSDAARANLNIKAEGQNEHHKIEAIFKAFAKSIKMAIKRDPEKRILPSTKGLL